VGEQEKKQGQMGQERDWKTGQPGQTGDQPGQMGNDQDWKTGQGGKTGRDWTQGSTDKEQGDQTRPAQPSGTTPLERDQGQKNQKR
jgi:hypothetical protein